MANIEEIWKDIPDYEGLYQVSNLGRVKSYDRIKNWGPSGNFIHKGRILKPVTHNKGYTQVRIYDVNGIATTRKIHRHVAIAFIPNPKKYIQINHKNGIKDDNRVENLEWVTNKENVSHCWESGFHKLTPYGKLHPRSRSVGQYALSGELIKIWDALMDAERAGYTAGAICNACRGKYKTHAGFIWKYI